MDIKTISFNISILAFIIAGVACLAFGIISLVRHYKGNKNKEKIKRGWTMSVLGTFLLAVFIPAFIYVVIGEMSSDGSFFEVVPLLLLFFFTPLLFVVAIVCLTFFLTIGVPSLKEGFAQRKEGKYDVESIVLGFVMITLGVIVLVSQIVFISVVFQDFIESIKESIANHNSRMESLR